MTALEMVRQVQRELRLPQSSSCSEPHAKLILDYINKIQRSFMMETVVWDELKVNGYFDTTINTSIYTVSVVSGEIELIRDMRIGTSPPLVHKSDEDFRELKRIYTTPGQPLFYRHYGRLANSILIEVLPTPDAVYAIATEVLKKPPKLSSDGEVPALDPDTIILGAIMLARKDQGDDFQTDLAAFQAKLGIQADTMGESNWGDVEAV